MFIGTVFLLPLTQNSNVLCREVLFSESELNDATGCYEFLFPLDKTFVDGSHEFHEMTE